MDVSGECKTYFFQISVLMGEPYFSTSLLPWHSLFFWYCRTALASLLRPNATILPSSATLHMMAVEFQVRQIFVAYRFYVLCVLCLVFCRISKVLIFSFVLARCIKSLCEQTGPPLYWVQSWLDKVGWGYHKMSFHGEERHELLTKHSQLNSDYCWSSLNAKFRMARFTFKII